MLTGPSLIQRLLHWVTQTCPLQALLFFLGLVGLFHHFLDEFLA